MNVANTTTVSTISAAPAVADWGAALALALTVKVPFCVSLIPEGQKEQMFYYTMAADEIQAKLQAMIDYPKSVIVFSREY